MIEFYAMWAKHEGNLDLVGEPYKNPLGQEHTFETGQEAAEWTRAKNELWKGSGTDLAVRVGRREVEATEAVAISYYMVPVGRPYLYRFDSYLPTPERFVSAHTPARHFVLDSRNAVTWRLRESARDNRGVPWLAESWWYESDHYWTHYPYVSDTDPGKIGFTESEQHGKQDRQTVMSPGRYLSRFFGHILTAGEVQRWALKWDTINAPATLYWARTPESIAEIYQEGPHSCMSYAPHEFSGDGTHPCEVYGYPEADPDIILAYIAREEGAPTGRALVNTREKTYARIYGDEARLQAALEDAGFRYGGSAALVGCRVAHIPVGWSGGNRVVMPYVDGGLSVTLEDGHGVLCHSGEGVQCDSCDGTLYLSDPCDHCGDHSDEMIEVRTRNGRETWCFGCDDYNAFWCDLADERVADHIGAEMTDDGRTAARDALEDEGWTYCPDCSQWTETPAIHERTGETVCADCLDTRAEDDAAEDQLDLEMGEEQAQAETPVSSQAEENSAPAPAPYPAPAHGCNCIWCQSAPYAPTTRNEATP